MAKVCKELNTNKLVCVCVGGGNLWFNLKTSVLHIVDFVLFLGITEVGSFITELKPISHKKLI